jgi:hypothetical protein
VAGAGAAKVLFDEVEFGKHGRILPSAQAARDAGELLSMRQHLNLSGLLIKRLIALPKLM